MLVQKLNSPIAAWGTVLGFITAGTGTQGNTMPPRLLETMATLQPFVTRQHVFSSLHLILLARSGGERSIKETCAGPSTGFTQTWDQVCHCAQLTQGNVSERELLVPSSHLCRPDQGREQPCWMSTHSASQEEKAASGNAATEGRQLRKLALNTAKSFCNYIN